MTAADSQRLETALGDRIRKIEHAFGAGRMREAAELLDSDFLSAWFGFTPDRLQALLGEFMRNAATQTPMIAAMHRYLTRPDESAVPSQASLTASLQRDMPEATAVRLVGALAGRLTGDPVDALERATAVVENDGLMDALRLRNKPWWLFISVQLGVTAMLAGDFSRALRLLQQAQVNDYDPKFAFLVRDALVRSALLQSLYGDEQVADDLLVRAQRMPRTESWAEFTIDASAVIAAAVTDEAPPEVRLDRLQGIEMRHIGELWPFYLAALHRVMTEAGQHRDLEHRLLSFEEIPWPHHDGRGFSGSVLPVLRAMVALVQHRSGDAEQLLQRADHSLPVTMVVDAHVQHRTGRSRRALTVLSQIPDIAELRGLTIWRRAIASSAHLALGEVDACRAELRGATAVVPSLTAREAWMFSPEVRALAAEQIEGWPEDDGYGSSASATAALSEREIEIVRALATGSTRVEIARTLFVSLNTVKTQLRSIFRKLDVSTAEAAVLEAERRGYL